MITEAELLCDGDAIRFEHLPNRVVRALEDFRGEIPPGPPPADNPDGAARARRPPPEVAELKELMRQHRGNVTHVARSLDRQWNVVWRWLQRHGIDPASYRAGDDREDPSG